jgi:hypothetical protein
VRPAVNAGAKQREPFAMGKRQPSNFRKTDYVRAVESARTSGIDPRMVEVVTKDGTTFRVYGDKTPEVEAAHASAAAVKEWDDATEKLKTEKKSPPTEKPKPKAKRRK